MKLKDIAYIINDKINSDKISIKNYVTTDSLLQDKAGKCTASNLPPTPCNLTSFKVGDILIANIRPYLKKIWKANINGGCSNDVLVFRAKNKDSKYLYSLLMQDSFFDYVMLGAKGSKMPRGDKEQILDFKIKEITYKERTLIGDFFDNITHLITLNRQINHNLPLLVRSSKEVGVCRAA